MPAPHILPHTGPLLFAPQSLRRVAKPGDSICPRKKSKQGGLPGRGVSEHHPASPAGRPHPDLEQRPSGKQGVGIGGGGGGSRVGSGKPSSLPLLQTWVPTLFSLGTKADLLCSRKGQGERMDSPRGPRSPLLGCWEK